jgi:hypothetical protein
LPKQRKCNIAQPSCFGTTDHHASQPRRAFSAICDRDRNSDESPPVFRGRSPVGPSRYSRRRAKSLCKDEKGVLWLIVCPEDSRGFEAAPAKIGSRRLSFGKAELLMEILGVEPGSVTPFGLINDKHARTNVILDAHMMEREILNYHPLKNDATTTIRSADLLTFIKSCGHEPRVVAVADPAL